MSYFYKLTHSIHKNTIHPAEVSIEITVPEDVIVGRVLNEPLYTSESFLQFLGADICAAAITQTVTINPEREVVWEIPEHDLTLLTEFATLDDPSSLAKSDRARLFSCLFWFDYHL